MYEVPLTKKEPATYKHSNAVKASPISMTVAPAAIWIAKDRECRRITGNPSSYKLLGVPEKSNVSATAEAGDAPERNFLEMRNGVPIPPRELPMQLAASSGVESEGTELTLRFPDGSERHNRRALR